MINRVLLIMSFVFLIVGCKGSRYYNKREMGFSKDWYLYSVTVDSSTKVIDLLGKLSVEFELKNGLLGRHYLCVKDNRENCGKETYQALKYIHCKNCPSVYYEKVHELHSYKIFTVITIEKDCDSNVYQDPIFQKKDV